MNRFSVLWKLKPYLAPHKSAIIIALLLSFPMAALNALPAWALKYFIDHVLNTKSEKRLLIFPMILVAGALLKFVVRFLHMYLIRLAANRMIQQLRNDMFNRLMKLSIGFFNEKQGGAILSVVMNDVQIIVKTVSGLVTLVREPITFIVLLGYAFSISWKLTILTLFIIPFVAFLFSNSGRHAKRYSNRIFEKMGEMSSILGESISGMRVIHSFNLERFMRGYFMRINRDFTRTALKAIRVEEMSHPALEVISAAAIAVLFYYGGKSVLRQEMSPGEFLSFVGSFGFMVQPLRAMNEMNITMNQCVAATENVFKILEQKIDINNSPNAQRMKPFQNEIEFRGVNFGYASDSRPILHDFSLRVKKGEVIALVGASGAGKTTVLSMIPRFFDPRQGQILVDGVNLRDLTIESLRAQVALVTQEVFLFHDSVRANIRAGKHGVNDQQIWDAAEAAQAANYIRSLPHGLDTEIGDRGQKLSGGERQRLSIARAILKDAPILLLDEATSALDSENERLVQAALDRLMVGRTAIIVAHRLSTIRKATRIIVMEKGEILEMGTHEELLAKGGAYSRALSLQEGFSESAKS